MGNLQVWEHLWKQIKREIKTVTGNGNDCNQGRSTTVSSRAEREIALVLEAKIHPGYNYPGTYEIAKTI